MKAAVIVLSVLTASLLIGFAIFALASFAGVGPWRQGWMPGGRLWPAPVTGGMGRGMIPWGRGDPVSTLEEAEAAFEAYVADLGYPDLAIHDVMDFEDNYYAIAVEPDTGIGAMELLLDKRRWTVGPEYGPNMMWNTRYGMHGPGMMGWQRGGGTMRLSPEDARVVAAEWLDANRPGTVPGNADPFYGYYTFHYLRDGAIEGMFSVHGDTGEVWFHDWHGDLLAAEEEGH